MPLWAEQCGEFVKVHSYQFPRLHYGRGGPEVEEKTPPNSCEEAESIIHEQFGGEASEPW